MTKKYFVGYAPDTRRYVPFKDIPANVTQSNYPQYGYVVGAFKTWRGAAYACNAWNHGNSGHWNQTVSQCEKLAKEQSHHA